MPISSLYLLGMRVSPSSRRLKIVHSGSSSSSGMRLKNVGTRPRVSLISASTSALVWTIAIMMLPFFVGGISTNGSGRWSGRAWDGVHPGVHCAPPSSHRFFGSLEGWGAAPSLVGRQVAVLRLHAASAGHVTTAAYSCMKEMYMLHRTK